MKVLRNLPEACRASRASLLCTIALPTVGFCQYFEICAGKRFFDLRVPATTTIAAKVRVATMMNELIEGVIERDESVIQVQCYQWSKRVDALTGV